MFEDAGHRLGARLPELRESGELQSPVIVGALRPVLLLPENFAHHTQDEAQAVFYHELAHVCRHDYLVNVICRLAALPVVWHPAIYGVQQRIRRTREMICDEIAAREMRSEIGYAKCLLAMAQRTLGQRDLADSAQAIGLFSDNILEERMMRLTESKSTMTLRVKLARVDRRCDCDDRRNRDGGPVPRDPDHGTVEGGGIACGRPEHYRKCASSIRSTRSGQESRESRAGSRLRHVAGLLGSTASEGDGQAWNF